MVDLTDISTRSVANAPGADGLCGNFAADYICTVDGAHRVNHIKHLGERRAGCLLYDDAYPVAAGHTQGDLTAAEQVEHISFGVNNALIASDEIRSIDRVWIRNQQIDRAAEQPARRAGIARVPSYGAADSGRYQADRHRRP